MFYSLIMIGSAIRIPKWFLFANKDYIIHLTTFIGFPQNYLDLI